MGRNENNVGSIEVMARTTKANGEKGKSELKYTDASGRTPQIPLFR